MSFEISEERMYHFPHNTLFIDELKFLLKSLDLNKKYYTFKEIVETVFVEEINKGIFKKFHGKMPYRIIVNGESPDIKYIRKKFENVKKSNQQPLGMPDDLFKNIISMNINDSVSYFLNQRRSGFEKALKNLENTDIFKVQYKPTKKWWFNWVEFVRDYIDFSAYCGLTPCYYKLPTKASPNDGYVITEKLKDFIEGKTTLEEILMDFKYSNSSINTLRYKQFNIRVRPFFSLLKLLQLLKQEKINIVEKKLLFGCISCLVDEKELDEVKNFIIDFIRKERRIERIYPEKLVDEIGRFATGMHRFLTETNLIEEISVNNKTCYKITDKGEKLIDSIPSNALFFGQYYEGMYYSPMVAFILKLFAEYSNNEVYEICIDDIIRQVKSLNRKSLISILNEIQNLKPSPIKYIDNSKILLNKFSNQYSVSPYVDFSSIEEAEFVYKGQTREIKTLKLKAKQIILPPEDVISTLHSSALGSDGTKYEDEVEKVLKLLKIGDVQRFGQRSRFERISDIVWKLKYETDGQLKTLLVIIEAKSGNAIYSFREDKESEDMINSIITHYRDEFTNLHGIWVLILDSDKIPDSEGHGGFRGDGILQKSFKDKLLKIHQRLLTSFGKPVLVTAFAIKPFIEYYKYLYSLIKKYKINEINSLIQEFYMKGMLFLDDYRYIKVINDEGYIRKNLVV